MSVLIQLIVGLNSKGCLCSILYIETYDIDTRLNKVTVTGKVTEEEVIRVIHKIGKTASTWVDLQQTNGAAAARM
ncbi:hypothetical protein RND81_08G080500 [Saponaria officinalis]|uniref:HMA domain-containing protein n=1 Tax=Saponaria officinalis TaxID=3572 RepID=A0AAW1J4N7_SAPOF